MITGSSLDSLIEFKVVEINLAEILISRTNSYTEEDVKNQVTLMTKLQLVKPIYVVSAGERFSLVSESTVVIALLKMGKTNFSCIEIIGSSDPEIARAIPFIQKAPTSVTSTAEFYSYLVNKKSLKYSEVARLVGMPSTNKASISRMITLLQLPDEVKELLNGDKIDITKGYQIASSGLAAEAQIRIAKTSTEFSLSARDLKQLIKDEKDLPGTRPGKCAITPLEDSGIDEACEKMSGILGISVRSSNLTDKGKAKLSITIGDAATLQELIDRMDIILGMHKSTP